MGRSAWSSYRHGLFPAFFGSLEQHSFPESSLCGANYLLGSGGDSVDLVMFSRASWGTSQKNTLRDSSAPMTAFQPLGVEEPELVPGGDLQAGVDTGSGTSWV